jgi:hypothetical protein
MENNSEQKSLQTRREGERVTQRRVPSDVVLSPVRENPSDLPPYVPPARRGSAAGLSLLLAIAGLLLLAVGGVYLTRHQYLNASVAVGRPAPVWLPPPNNDPAAQTADPNTIAPAAPATAPSPSTPDTANAPTASAPGSVAPPVFSVPNAPATGTDSADPNAFAPPNATPPSDSTSDVTPDSADANSVTTDSGDPSSGTALPNDGLNPPGNAPTTPTAPPPSSGLPDPNTPNAPPAAGLSQPTSLNAQSPEQQGINGSSGE